MQAESASLIGQAIQQNPAFLTLRKIEVSISAASTLRTEGNGVLMQLLRVINACCNSLSCTQAAREIAGTIATANNRVLLNSESLLLNLVSQFSLGPKLQAKYAFIVDCWSTSGGNDVSMLSCPTEDIFSAL